MKNESAIKLTEQRINDLGLYLAEFALDFVPGDDDVNTYNANDFLALVDAWFPYFTRYAETNGMLENGEREALAENKDDLVNYIKDTAVDAAKEILMEQI
jgi:dsDNA-binding SOS-regulon protein